MHRFAPIQTPSLILRELSPDDVSKVFQMSLEAGMRQWIPDQVYQNEAQTAQVLDFLTSQYKDITSPAKSPLVFGVCLKQTHELIGHVGLSPLKNQTEIGFAIEDTHQGKGYASEAVVAMVQWGHDTFGLSAILGVAAKNNKGSCRVLEKSGFELVKEEQGVLHNLKGLIRTYTKTFVA